MNFELWRNNMNILMHFLEFFLHWYLCGSKNLNAPEDVMMNISGFKPMPVTMPSGGFETETSALTTKLLRIFS